jgi:hypothetical protein
MIENMYEELVASASRVWVCHRSDNPTLTIRFIPKPEKVKVPKVSSSMIRKLIQDSPLGQLETKLNELVLHPDILLAFLALRPKSGANDIPARGEKNHMAAFGIEHKS